MFGIRVCSKNKRQSLQVSFCGSSTNGPATRLEKQIDAAQGIRTQDNTAHTRLNHHQLLLGNWNITLLGIKLVEEPKYCNILF